MPHRVKEIKVDMSSGAHTAKVIKSNLRKGVAQNWADKMNAKQELPPVNRALEAGKDVEEAKYITSYVVEEF